MQGVGEAATWETDVERDDSHEAVQRDAEMMDEFQRHSGGIKSKTRESDRGVGMVTVRQCVCGRVVGRVAGRKPFRGASLPSGVGDS